MAFNDIRPYHGTPGGSPNKIQWCRLAATTLLPGEPCVITAGQATECADDPAVVVGVVGLGPVNGFTGTYLNFPFVNGLNPDRATAAGDAVPVVLNSHDQWWMTRTLLTGGGTFSVAPVVATHVGALASLDLIGGVWGLNPAAGTNQIWRIMDVLDAQGRSLVTQWSGAGAGVVTVFKLSGAVAGAVAPS